MIKNFLRFDFCSTAMKISEPLFGLCTCTFFLLIDEDCANDSAILSL